MNDHSDRTCTCGKHVALQLTTCSRGQRTLLNQVRSLASETARQASRAPRQWRLLWYAADFREERSALDSTLLVSDTSIHYCNASAAQHQSFVDCSNARP